MQVMLMVYDIHYIVYSIFMKQNIGCIKAANEILGDKWTPQLLRAISNNDRIRFCQLQDAVGGINPRTLSNRLNNLEEKGVIISRPDAQSSYNSFSLTEKGNGLIPILLDMEKWSKKYHKNSLIA